MIIKETVIDKIEVMSETGHVLVRRATYFTEDGKRVSEPQYYRDAYFPGADVSKEDIRIISICGLIWTKEVVDAFNAKVAKEEKNG